MRPEPRFSARTRWDLRHNRMTEALERRRMSGLPILDLTATNPTRCGLAAENPRVLSMLARPEGLVYEPDPRGRLDARRAVEDLYAERGVRAGAERIVLTASTSEAYAWLFRLLCDPGDSILAPIPSYPLFDHLARVSDVSLARYPLIEEEGFRIDLHALEGAITDRTRAILVVSPGNPTGAFLEEDQREAIVDLCARRGLAVVCDEVFGDFPLDGRRARTLAGESRTLTFVLDGISKMLGLPQLKLGWIVAGGPAADLDEALARLEVIGDTFLSVGSPVQAALPGLLSLRQAIQAGIQARLNANLRVLEAALPAGHPARALSVGGGWSAVVRVPVTRSDEEWAITLLEEEGVLVHPGFLFDFPSEGRLVISLLPEEVIFRDGAERMARRLAGA